MTKRVFKPQKLLWIDLEMTGLDPVRDRILEVAAIVTDWEFREIATYEAIQKVSPRLMTRQMSISFWDENASTREALIAQNLHGKDSRVVEDELVAFVDQHIGTQELIVLAGNSIHQDRRFIAREWTRLEAKLHYRMLDVSAWKVVFEGKYGKKFAKPEVHRALSDIRGSIEELRYYLKICRIHDTSKG